MLCNNSLSREVQNKNQWFPLVASSDITNAIHAGFEASQHRGQKKCAPVWRVGHWGLGSWSSLPASGPHEAESPRCGPFLSGNPARRTKRIWRKRWSCPFFNLIKGFEKKEEMWRKTIKKLAHICPEKYIWYSCGEKMSHTMRERILYNLDEISRSILNLMKKINLWGYLSGCKTREVSEWSHSAVFNLKILLDAFLCAVCEKALQHFSDTAWFFNWLRDELMHCLFASNFYPVKMLWHKILRLRQLLCD